MQQMCDFVEYFSVKFVLLTRMAHGISHDMRTLVQVMARCRKDTSQLLDRWADQRKHQSSALLVFVKGVHQWPVVSLHKGSVTWKMFPFDYVIMPSRGHMSAVGNWWFSHVDPPHVFQCRRCSNYIFIFDLTPGFKQIQVQDERRNI